MTDPNPFSTIPSSMFITIAKESLLDVDQATAAAVVKELAATCYAESRDVHFVNGYLLGIATAFVLKMLTSDNQHASEQTH